MARVKALYEELDLQAVFLQYEEDSYSHIMALIDHQSGLSRSGKPRYLKREERFGAVVGQDPMGGSSQEDAGTSGVWLINPPFRIGRN